MMMTMMTIMMCRAIKTASHDGSLQGLRAPPRVGLGLHVHVQGTHGHLSLVLRGRLALLELVYVFATVTLSKKSNVAILSGVLSWDSHGL